MLFFNANVHKRADDTDKKIINSDEYDRVLKRISELNTDITALKGNYEILKSDISNLRGRFNQKLKGLQADEVKPETEKDINDPFVPFG